MGVGTILFLLFHFFRGTRTSELEHIHNVHAIDATDKVSQESKRTSTGRKYSSTNQILEKMKEEHCDKHDKTLEPNNKIERIL